jgi:EmrB/QacA subfamily drug resistance transporter
VSAHRKSLALIVVSAVILLDALDLSITQVALPDIGHDLALSSGLLQWVPNAYVLTYGALLLLGGRLADVLGRKRVFLAGLLVFGGMSLVCGIAPSAAVLVAARALQGVGAALTVPAAVAIIAATFAEGAERNRALGIFGASGSAGFSVGLVLGGVLTDALSWRWVFLVKVPVVVVALLLALRAVGEGRPARTPAGYDAGGAVASVLGVLLLVLGITQLGDRTLPVAPVAGALAAGVALLAIFLIHERRTPEPLLPLGLFSSPALRSADLASLTVLAAPFGLSFITTLWMQDVLGYSPLTTGLSLLPGAALSIVVSRYVAPWLVDRFGVRLGGGGALIVVGLGFLFMLGVAAEPRYTTVLLPATLVSFGLGMGAAYPIYTIASVAGVAEERQGVAAGVQNTALQVGGGLGLALVSAAVTASLGDAQGSARLVDALRVGAAVGAALPLIGAIVTFLGVPAEGPAPAACTQET